MVRNPVKDHVMGLGNVTVLRQFIKVMKNGMDTIICMIVIITMLTVLVNAPLMKSLEALPSPDTLGCCRFRGASISGEKKKSSALKRCSGPRGIVCRKGTPLECTRTSFH